MEPPELRRRSQLIGDGYTEDEVRRRLRTGLLTSVRPGTYLTGPAPDDAVARHALAAAAALDQLAAGTVASHVTAAVLHGLPVWGIALRRVHVTRSRRTGGRTGPRLHLHSTPLAPEEITSVGGLRVTDLSRTLADLGRTEPFDEAVAVTDAALHTGRLTREELLDAAARASRWPGAPALRRVVDFSDGRSASVGESRSRVAMHRTGLPVPVLQWEVTGADGRWIARADFGWPSLRTVGEFDGEIKYGRLLRPGQTPGDVLMAEKRREDAIRDRDLAVVRWTWPDLMDFSATAARLRRRFRPAR